jgi:hypothetical protein
VGAVWFYKWVIAAVIFHYNGSSWSLMSLPATTGPVGLYGVWGSSATDVFAVGDGGTILHYGPPD